jgi:hypothetical protein
MTPPHLLITLSIVALLSSTSLGCSIMSELDGAHEEMGVGEEEEADAARVAKRSKKGKKARTMAKAKKWWKKVESLSPIGIDESIGKCTLGGQVKYMTQDDCRSRGGVMGSG